jgi:hypothetical protein
MAPFPRFGGRFEVKPARSGGQTPHLPAEGLAAPSLKEFFRQLPKQDYVVENPERICCKCAVHWLFDGITRMDQTELFVETVRASQNVPADARSHADEARGVRESCFEESYIKFLNEQIRSNPDGSEWTEILRRRREDLRPFCDVPLVSGHVRSGRFDTWIIIEPKSQAVVHWEHLEFEPTA